MSYALRLWIRQASRQRALTAFLMLSLAVALGGGAFALSLNSAVLWRSPFENARDLVSIDARDSDGRRRWLSWRELESVEAWTSQPFESIAGYTAADFNALSEPGLPPEPLSATVVSPSFFNTFRFAAAMGPVTGSRYLWCEPRSRGPADATTFGNADIAGLQTSWAGLCDCPDPSIWEAVTRAIA